MAISLPTPGGDTGSWGAKLNAALTALDGRHDTLIEYVDGNAAPLSHLTDADPHGDRDYTDTELALLADDPLGLGFASTFLPGSPPGGTQTWVAANDVRYVRLVSGGVASKVGFQVFTASGNLMVAAYRGVNAGRSRIPGTRLAVSAVTPCPAAGYQEISLDSTVTLLRGDFLAVWCDNTTAALASINGSTNNLYAGYYYGQTAQASGPPVTPTPTATSAKVPLLIGVP